MDKDNNDLKPGQETANGSDEGILSEQPQNADMQKLEKELQSAKDSWLRTAAELDNAKKKWLKEKEELFVYAQAELIKAIIPVLDHFENAMKILPKDKDEFEQGVVIIYKEFNNILGKHGLQKINDIVGCDFDPFCQEAVGYEQHDDVEENKIIEVLRPGYKFKDILIRPAMVRVSKGKSDNSIETNDEGQEDGQSEE
ncbi:MAG: nucleotide exchange factor GrpE [Candidatus Omnitrophica bacterium]|nr:nucleotide exchange factor GrpE [Candidatus Omnitrophota bacterium]